MPVVNMVASAKNDSQLMTVANREDVMRGPRNRV